MSLSNRLCENDPSLPNITDEYSSWETLDITAK